MSHVVSTALLVPATTVAVAPTSTTVVNIDREDLRGARVLVIQLSNLDPSQTFSGALYSRIRDMSLWAARSNLEFESVAPGTSVVADINIEGTDELELRGAMSGAGGDVQVGVVRKAGQ